MQNRAYCTRMDTWGELQRTLSRDMRWRTAHRPKPSIDRAGAEADHPWKLLMFFFNRVLCRQQWPEAASPGRAYKQNRAPFEGGRRTRLKHCPDPPTAVQQENQVSSDGGG